MHENPSRHEAIIRMRYKHSPQGPHTSPGALYVLHRVVMRLLSVHNYKCCQITDLHLNKCADVGFDAMGRPWQMSITSAAVAKAPSPLAN